MVFNKLSPTCCIRIIDKNSKGCYCWIVTMNVLHLHCDLSSCPSSSFIRPKVAISNLYQQPIYRETCRNSEQTKLSSLKIIYDKGHRDPRFVSPLSPSGLQVEGKSNQGEGESNQVEGKSNQVQDSDTQLRHSDTKKVSLSNKQRDIVNFCSVPRTTAEIMERLGLSNQTKNRERYITSLVAAGYLQMTNPENPTASNQKYKKVTTTK